MRLQEQGMICIGNFDRSNFACSYACSCKTECESLTPEAIKNSNKVAEEIARRERDCDVESSNEVAEEIARRERDVESSNGVAEEIAGAEAIEPKDVVQESIPVNDVTETAPNKQSVHPSSRFDIIDISKEEKE